MDSITYTDGVEPGQVTSPRARSGSMEVPGKPAQPWVVSSIEAW
jgi:hypothetical protein